jgi:SAM-dependent methyltransferase
MRPVRRILWSVIVIVIVLGLCVTGQGQKREPDVEFVATPEAAVREMLRLAKVTKDDVVYDLGCGDGRIVIMAAKEFGARGVGVDIDPYRITESNENALRAGVSNRVKFLEQDLFEADLREATVVTLFLLSELNLRLRPKLLRELKPGTRIVSHDFDMGDWKPDGVRFVLNVPVYFSDGTLFKRGATLNYWVVPADAAGSWRWTLQASSSPRHYALHLSQKFQELSAKVNIQGRDRVIQDIRLVGERLTFTVKDEIDGQEVKMRFSGLIRDDTINGSAETAGRPIGRSYNWTARRER